LVRPPILTFTLVVSLIASMIGGSLEVRAQSPLRRLDPRHKEPRSIEPKSIEPRHVEPVSDEIRISAESISTQQDGPGVHVHILRGEVRIEQGSRIREASEMVLWQSSQNGLYTLRGYVKQSLKPRGGHSPRSDRWIVLESTKKPILTPTGKAVEPLATPVESPLYHEAVEYRKAREARLANSNSPIQQSGHSRSPRTLPSVVPIQVVQAEQKKSKPTRRIRLTSRSTGNYNFDSVEDTRKTPPEQIITITGGVRLVIEGIEKFDVLDLTADRVVIWTRSLDQEGIQAVLEQGADAPLQFYLEGNIIIRQGENELRATRAFYDLREDRAILIEAELKMPDPSNKGRLRLRGEQIRQIDRGTFIANDAWVSTSTFGKPGYRVQASDIKVETPPSSDIRQVSAEQVEIDEQTGLPVENAEPLLPLTEGDPWVTSHNNSLWIDDYPIAYVPFLAAPLSDTGGSFPSVTVGNDRIFGTQVRTVTNLMNLLKIKPAPGNELNLMADYLSKRGPAGGLKGRFHGFDPFGMGSVIDGKFLGYGIYDTGRDNLGADRQSLIPENNARGRVHLDARERFNDDMYLDFELGWLSDRNFLEQYFERDFDTAKDDETLLNFNYANGNRAASILGRYMINDFDTGSSWLPKADLYLLGEPLLNGWMTLTSRATAGYAQLQVGANPSDPSDLYVPLPYVADLEGLVLSTRHEISAPINLGFLNIAPYAMGEAAYWGQDFTGNELGRLYGSAGVRGSMMMWRAFPGVHSEVFGLRELAHKMVFDFDYSYSDSSVPLSEIPQYNEFDDQAQYRFRNRLIQNTFGGILPEQFDPRAYALRTGAAHSVTSPYWELVDSQQVLRLGWRHRLQTKTGPLDNERIKDWMTLDLDAAFFPDSIRDNFGEDWGLYSGRYAWYVGDRTTFLANAFYDTFADAQQLWSVGLISQRTTRGSVYLGVRQVKGANLDSQILTASYSYQMTPKWISTVGTAYDLGEQRNRGQSFTLSRVGKDFILHVGGNYDVSRDNLGIAISLEPRFLSLPGSGGQSSNQLGSLLQTY